MSIPTPHAPHEVKHSSGVSVLQRSNQTMRLRSPEGQYVWLQNGYVYDDTGKPIDPPDWLEGDFTKMTPTMQEVHALKDEAKAGGAKWPVPQETASDAKLPAKPKGLVEPEQFPVMGDEGVLVEPNPGPFPEEFNDPGLLDEQKKEATAAAEAAHADLGGEADDLGNLNKADLVAKAKAEGVEVSAADTKAMIANKIIAKHEE